MEAEVKTINPFKRVGKMLLISFGVAGVLILILLVNKLYNENSRWFAFEVPPTSREMLKLVNIERAKEGLEPYKLNYDVQKIAQIKADDMYDRNYYKHKIPGTDSLLPEGTKEVRKSVCSEYGENISLEPAKTTTSKTVVHGWMDSPPHRAAILSPTHTHVGFGVADTIAVMHFCTIRQ